PPPVLGAGWQPGAENRPSVRPRPARGNLEERGSTRGKLEEPRLTGGKPGPRTREAGPRRGKPGEARVPPCRQCVGVRGLGRLRAGTRQVQGAGMTPAGSSKSP